jgi:hypothetical protein
MNWQVLGIGAVDLMVGDKLLLPIGVRRIPGSSNCRSRIGQFIPQLLKTLSTYLSILTLLASPMIENIEQSLSWVLFNSTRKTVLGVSWQQSPEIGHIVMVAVVPQKIY